MEVILRLVSCAMRALRRGALLSQVGLLELLHMSCQAMVPLRGDLLFPAMTMKGPSCMHGAGGIALDMHSV